MGRDSIARRSTRFGGVGDRSRKFLPFLVGLLLCAPTGRALAAHVLVVVSSDREPYRQAEAALCRELEASGHTTRSVTLGTPSFGDGILRASAGEGTASRACVAIGTEAARWLNVQQRSDLVCIYCMVADPVGLGLGRQNPFPGITTDVPLAAQFRLIEEVLPRARKVGMMFRGGSDLGERTVAEVRRQLPAGWDLAAIPVEKHEDFSAALDEMFDRGVEVVWTSPDPGIYDAASVRALLLAALRRQVPVFGFSPPFVRAGALLGVGVSPQAQGRQAADLLRELLSSPRGRGRQSGRQLAARQPEFEIALNLIVAAKLSLRIPDDVVSRAAHVVGK